MKLKNPYTSVVRGKNGKAKKDTLATLYTGVEGDRDCNDEARIGASGGKIHVIRDSRLLLNSQVVHKASRDETQSVRSNNITGNAPLCCPEENALDAATAGGTITTRIKHENIIRPHGGRWGEKCVFLCIFSVGPVEIILKECAYV